MKVFTCSSLSLNIFASRLPIEREQSHDQLAFIAYSESLDSTRRSPTKKNTSRWTVYDLFCDLTLYNYEMRY